MKAYNYLGQLLQSGGGGGGGASLTVEELDGSPSYTGITKIIFDQGDGFVLTQPVAGQVRVDSTGAPAPDSDARVSAWMGL